MSQNQSLQNSRVDLFSTRDLDFHGRKISNASDGISPQDYITLSQLTNEIDTLTKATTRINQVVNNSVGSISIGDIVKQGTGKSVLFIDVNGNLAQDNANFQYASGTILLGGLTASLPVKTTTGKTLTASAISLASGSVDITGILSVPNGGSGLANIAANSVLLGNGTSAFGTVAGIASGSLSLSLSSASPGTTTTVLNYTDSGGNPQTSPALVTSVTGTFLTNATITANAFTHGVRTT